MKRARALLAIALLACDPPSAPTGASKDGGGALTDGGGADATLTDASGPADLPPADAAANDACALFATGYCADLETCRPFDLQVGFGDLAVCRQRAALACLYELAAPETSLTWSNVAACAVQISTAVDGGPCTSFQWNTYPACATLPGPRAPGAPCTTNGQCQSASCKRPAGQRCGTCGAAPAESSPCVCWNDCGVGRSCYQGFCISPKKLGDACATACGPSLTCVTGKCAAYEVCPDDSDPCDFSAGYYCESTCTSRGVVGAGQSCAIAGCVGGGVCNDAGLCLAPQPDGFSCEGATCLFPAECTGTPGSRTCVLPDPRACP